MFKGLANFIMKHAKLIICVWVLLLIVSAPSIYKVLVQPETILQYDMTNMLSDDSESAKGDAIIKDTDYFYQTDLGTDMVLVIECPDTDYKSAIETVFIPLLKTNLQEYYDPENKGGIISTIGLGFYSKNVTEDGKSVPPGINLVSIAFLDGRNSTSEIKQIRSLIEDTKKELNEIPAYSGMALTTYVTGNTAISQDSMDGAMEDVKKIDPFSVLLVLVLIGLFFRSIISSATPPITIGFAYGILMIVVVLVTNYAQVYYITTTLALVAMLGAGCDYCIFIIARYREERIGGKNKEDALREAIIWAGESITISGLSVIIGFGVMSFCSFVMISTMGIILAAGIIIALLAALTLIPSIIMLIGDRIFWPSRIETYMPDSKAMNGIYGLFSNIGKWYFRKSALTSIRHAWAIVVIAILISVPLGYVAFTQNTTYDIVATLPDGEAKDGINAIVENADGGLIMPTYIVMDAGEKIAEIKDDGLIIKKGGEVIDVLGTLQWGYQDEHGAWKQSLEVGKEYYIATSDDMTGKGKRTTTDESLVRYVRESASNGYTTDDNIASIRGTISTMQMLYDYGASPSQIKELLEKAKDTLPDELKSKMDDIYNYGMTTGAADVKLSTAEMINAYDYLLNYYIGSLSVYKDGHQYIKVTVTVKDEPMSDLSMETLKKIDSGIDKYMSTEKGQELFVSQCLTGNAVANEEVSVIMDKEFSVIEIAVVILIFILLFIVMGSYLTPVRSIVTILMSIVWTLGVTHLLFNNILHMQVTWIVPIVLFVICLGLGMDYDILLTTRVKENVKKGLSNDEAIEHAVEKSGAIITICGLIMGGAFMTMALSTSPMLMEFGFALGFAILVDALVIRTYIVPAVMHILGRYNWVGPKFLNRN